jgi:hypothetical protein
MANPKSSPAKEGIKKRGSKRVSKISRHGTLGADDCGSLLIQKELDEAI